MNVKSIALISLLAACGAATAQDRLVLISTQDLTPLTNADTDPNTPGNQPSEFYIGSNPSAVALVGDRLFVAGWDNGGIGSTEINKVVVIENIFGARAFRNFPDSIFVDHPTFRGFTGFAYEPGKGLLLTRDTGGITSGAMTLWDVDTQLTPIRVAGSEGIGGAGGPAWVPGSPGDGDGGWADLGVTHVASTLDFRQGTYEIRVGVIGLSPTDLSPLFFYGNPPTPAQNNLRMDFVGLTGTTWRDMAAIPDGTIIARANNDMVIGTRPNDDWNFVGQTHVELGDAPFVNGQNVAVIEGLDQGNVIIFNDRASGATGQTYANVVKFLNMDGSAGTNVLYAADGVTPFAEAATNNGYFDFYWDRANGRLALLSFSSGQCYIFEAPGNACPADFNGDGFVDFFDFDDFVICFEGGACPPGKTADYNGDGFADFFDYDDFVLDFETGCP